MRIILTCEPWKLQNNTSILLKLSIEGLGDKQEYQKVIEEDWFNDESLFKRIVLGMAGDLQKYYKEQKDTK